MRTLLIFAVFVLILSGCASRPPTAVGQYKEWNGGELESVEILERFHLRDYRTILVLPLDTAGLVVAQDNTRIPVEKSIAKAPKVIADEIDGDLPNRMHVKAKAGSAPQPFTPEVLLLRLKLVEMNPGSAVARIYSLGFGGATHITLTGEIVDSATGKVFVRFEHHNYHSKSGLINKYTAALEENEEQIAESVAKLLKAFYP